MCMQVLEYRSYPRVNAQSASDAYKKHQCLYNIAAQCSVELAQHSSKGEAHTQHYTPSFLMLSSQHSDTCIECIELIALGQLQQQ